jgi:hypothetical protein
MSCARTSSNRCRCSALMASVLAHKRSRFESAIAALSMQGLGCDTGCTVLVPCCLNDYLESATLGAQSAKFIRKGDCAYCAYCAFGSRLFARQPLVIIIWQCVQGRPRNRLGR